MKEDSLQNSLFLLTPKTFYRIGSWGLFYKTLHILNLQKMANFVIGCSLTLAVIKRLTLTDTLAYYRICTLCTLMLIFNERGWLTRQFFPPCSKFFFIGLVPRARPIKNYRFVIYYKQTNFVIFLALTLAVIKRLILTDTLAYYRICTLRTLMLIFNERGWLTKQFFPAYFKKFYCIGSWV